MLHDSTPYVNSQGVHRSLASGSDLLSRLAALLRLHRQWHDFLSAQVDDNPLPLYLPCHDQQRRLTEYFAILRVDIRAGDDVEKPMLVLQRDEVMPFGGRRCLMDDNLSNDMNARLLVRVFK